MIRRLVLSVVVALWVGPGAFGDEICRRSTEKFSWVAGWVMSS